MCEVSGPQDGIQVKCSGEGGGTLWGPGDHVTLDTTKWKAQLLSSQGAM